MFAKTALEAGNAACGKLVGAETQGCVAAMWLNPTVDT